MSTDERVLEAIFLCPMSANTLAMILNMSPSFMRSTLSDLKDEGLIYPHDRHKMALRKRSARSYALTPKGIKTVQQLLSNR